MNKWTEPCRCCKEINWWKSTHGVVICGICHPPVSPEVVKEWLNQPKEEEK